MQAVLSSICMLPEKNRGDKYCELIEDKLGMGDTSALKQIVDHILSNEVGQATARKVIQHLAPNIKKMLEKLDAKKYEEVAEYVVRSIHRQNMASIMEESDFLLRNQLFEHYKKEADYSSAATALAGIAMENSTRKWSSPVEKATAVAEHYVKVAEAYLLEDETVDAEIFVSKAMAFMGDVADIHLRIRYKATHGKILDSNRKFLDAAWIYYELSQSPSSLIRSDDLLVLLGKAVTCVILGKAGPQRDRILNALYKDERLGNLELVDGFATHGQVLSKMYMQQVLRKGELRTFEEGLKEHQKAVMADGLTIPQRAIIEHNMAAAYKIYENIRFSELGSLLEISTLKAEQIAARMISEGRLNGSIDQVDGVLNFLGDRSTLKSWDDRILDICLKMNRCCEDVETCFPQVVG